MTKDFIIGLSCGVVLSMLVFGSFCTGCIIAGDMAAEKLVKQYNGRLEVLK